MRLRSLSVLVALVLAAAGLGSARAQEGVLRAGFARADVTWHTPGAQGQYSDAGNTVLNDKFDPYLHNAKTEPSDGLHSRSYARAVVVEGPDGTRVAYVGHDLYLQQDVLTRRVAQLVEAADVGITGETLMIGASHNHSATSLSSTAWGVWAFTDVGDHRFFDFVSRRIAQAVVDAAEDMRPVRVGAAVSVFDDVQQNILGPAVADDGTPAGFPYDYFDPELAVVRFDDVSDPANPKPYGMLVNLGMHPESLDTIGMPSADFVGMVERMVTERTGAAVSWSQGAVGDIEPDRDARANPPEERHEYWHRDLSQMERMSRIVADAVVNTWHDVATGETDVPEKHVAFSTTAPVAMLDRTFAGPASHPAPTVSNCRTDEALGGQPGVPVVGLPDCRRVAGADLGFLYDEAQEHEIPLPGNYGVTGYGGAQESLNAHLQVLRIGEILLATCPCEPVTDMVRNFKSRANPAAGDIFDGFDWPCRPAGDDVECDFAKASWRPDDWRPVPRALYERMRAQIHNDAAGWDAEDPASVLGAEAEPDDPSEIKGNFTKEEIQASGADGFTLPLMVGQANDYIGYVVTYREYQRGDHYRKALTAFGPHTADYINTRLVRMAAALDGGQGAGAELLDATVPADAAANEAKALTLGEGGAQATAAYEAALPDDGGEPFLLGNRERSYPRFDGAQVRWVGGSVYTDLPAVTVERLVDDRWTSVAGQDGGEVVLNVFYEKTSDPGVWARWAAGDHATAWQATWEVFEETAPGTYRFVIEGEHRSGGEERPYRIEADPFEVRPWAGITLSDPLLAGDTASFVVDPIRFPHTWEGIGVPYVSEQTSTTQTGTWCFRCTIRPWASTSEPVSGVVTVRHAGGSEDRYPATFDGTRWVATGLTVVETDTVLVQPGGVRDAYGNLNGQPLVIYEPPLDDGR